MGLGTFAGGGLGMGVAFMLHDEFSQTAAKIERAMGSLDTTTDVLANKMDRAMNKIKLGFGMATAGALILAPFVMGVKNASDLEENLNKTRVAFGRYASDVEAFAAKSIDTFGIDKIMALDMASLFGDMSTGMGIGQQQASKLAITLTGLAGDLASFKNISHDVAKTALKGIFTGETESLKGLGIVMTEANLQASLAAKGITKSFKDLSQSEKVMARFNYVMEVSKNSIGDFQRTSEGYANSKRTFEGALKELSATLGNVLMPMFARIIQWATRLAKKFKEFAESPMGKAILRIVAAIGIFLLIGGTLLILMGGIRFVVYKAALAFNGLTRAQILSTIATKGTVAGLRAIGAAAWTALGPFVLIAAGVFIMIKVFRWLKSTIYSTNPAIVALGSAILFALGPIGWIILAVNFMRRAVMEFDKVANGTAKKQGGFIGFLQKLGGVLRGVQQIWRSWNDTTRTFELPKAMEKHLKTLGIHQLVLNIGTWVARIKAFMKGVKDAFVDAYNWAKGIIKNWLKSMESITGPWDKLHLAIGKNKDSMEKWRDIGKKVGKVLLIVIGGLVVALLAMGAVALLVLVAMIAPFVLIGYAIYKLNEKINKFKSDISLIGTVWNHAFDSMYAYITALPDRMYKAGVEIVNSIIAGLKSAWDGLVGWLTGAWDGLINIFSSKEIGVNFMGNSDEKKPGTALATVGAVKPMGAKVLAMRNAQSIAQNKQAQNNTKSTTTNTSEVIKTEDIHVHVSMDGNEVAKQVIEKTKYKNARK